MGAPSNQFLCLLDIGGPLKSVSSHTIRGSPQTCFFAYYMGAPSDQFLRVLHGGPHRSISSFTIWGVLDFFFSFLRVKLSWGVIFLIFRGGQVPPLDPPPPCGRPCKYCIIFLVNNEQHSFLHNNYDIMYIHYKCYIYKICMLSYI